MVDTGSNAYVKYGYQNNYDTIANPINQIFGKDQKVSGLTWMTNQQEISQLYTPEIQDFVYGRNEGKCSIDYTLSNPWIFGSVLNSRVTITGDDDPDDDSVSSYEHVWTSDPASNSGIRALRPLSVEFGFDSDGLRGVNKLTRTARGANTTTLNLKTAINDKVSVSQSLEWANQTSTENTTFAPPNLSADSEFTPLMFHHASLETPEGITLAQVQDVDLTIDTGSAQWYGLGSENGVDLYRRLLKITGKFTLAVQDSVQFDKVVARPAKADIDLYFKISNGLTGTAEQSINIKCERVGFGEHSTNYEPGEPIIENMPFQAGRINIFSNTPNGATAPANA